MVNNISDTIVGVVKIVMAADGEIVGRTRLQKTAYILSLAGADLGFSFAYRHYGPFSQQLADVLDLAQALGKIREERRSASWGGFYSVYRSASHHSFEQDSPWQKIVQIAKDADAVELELAATAAHLRVEGFSDPWMETQSRKPDKAIPENLVGAKRLYSEFLKVETPRQLPAL